MSKETVNDEQVLKMTKEEATKKISDLLDCARAIIREAESISLEYEVDFYFGVTYGMGGNFWPDRCTDKNDPISVLECWSPSSIGC